MRDGKDSPRQKSIDRPISISDVPMANTLPEGFAFAFLGLYVLSVAEEEREAVTSKRDFMGELRVPVLVPALVLACA